MATLLRVKLVTCVLILLLCEDIYAFGDGRHDELARNEEHVRDKDLDDVNNRVRRGAAAGRDRAAAPDLSRLRGAGAPAGLGMAQVPAADRLKRQDLQNQGFGAVPQQRGFPQAGGAQQQQFAKGREFDQNRPQVPVAAGGLVPGGMAMGGVPQNQPGAGQVQFQPGVGQQLQPGQQLPVQNFQNPLAARKLDAAVGGKLPKSRTAPLKPVRIAEHPACVSDVQRLCPRKGNNFAVLDCLQKTDKDISDDCNHFLWNYKMNLTMDYRFDNAAAEVCREDIRRFEDCNGLDAGKGLILPCLLGHFEDLSNAQCTQYLNRMKEITFSDFRLIQGFYDSCKGDISKYSCGTVNEQGNAPANVHHTQGGTIHCLERNVQKLEQSCKLQILRVAELSSNDYHEDRMLYFACRDDRERFCPNEVSGQGKIYKCLKEHKFSKEMTEDCKSKLTTRQKLTAQDYKVNFRLQRKCKKELASANCNLGEVKTKEIKLASILICLEQWGRDDTHQISGDCQAELTDTRKEIMSDYMINPELMESCGVEIERDCKGVRREGKTIHCLMGLAKKDGALTPECKKALSDLVEKADAGSDYRLDPALQKACSETKDLLCHKKTDAEALSCLMENIEDERMKDECSQRLLEIQYFISRNWRLDPVLFKNCKEDASLFCYQQNWSGGGETPSGLVFSCLHRHLHGHENPLQPRCADQVHRVLRQRAVSVHLNPRIEAECRGDLGKLCNEKTKRGEELKCLQENIKDLTESCHLAVGNFTVEEAEDIQMNRKLIAACAPMLRKFCQDKLREKKVDEGEALKCLVENKNDNEMEAKCQASIEHFQLIQLKDYRFSFKFKESCRKDVLKLCKGSRDKPSIIKCLSATVRDSVLKGETPQLDQECRAQLKFELLQRDENIELDPELKTMCMKEVSQYCSKVTQGNARVMECLRTNQANLGNECHKKVFNREKEMASKPDIDYALMHSCKKTIKTKCKNVEPDKLIDCLKSHKDDPDTDPRCKMVLTKRQIERNSNIQLNPQLRKACKMDIHKFCVELEQQAQTQDDNAADMEGKVITCLRGEFSKRESKLTPNCEKHLGGLLKEGAEDYRLDRTLVKFCGKVIHEKCPEEMENPGSGRVEECLKAHVQEIKDQKCQQQVIGLFREGLADVHVDPLLYKACALDIKHYCTGIPQGQGQQMSCLLEALEEKSVSLQRDCRRMLSERKEMWEYAAQVAPALGLLDIYTQIRNSPAHNYFMMVFLSLVGVLFFFGLCCGRATKRIRQEVKNK